MTIDDIEVFVNRDTPSTTSNIAGIAGGVAGGVVVVVAVAILLIFLFLRRRSSIKDNPKAEDRTGK